MTEPAKVDLFLEDIAHESFVYFLVARAAKAEGLTIVQNVRNAAHGSKVWKELERFFEDAPTLGRMPDALVVVVDGNCRGFSEVRKRIREMADGVPIPNIVCGVPHPHIERWYLADPSALQKTLTCTVSSLPKAKCRKDLYKKMLGDAIRKAGVAPQLGGAEYGEDIACAADVDELCKRERSFKAFWDDLTGAFKRLAEDRRGGEHGANGGY